MCQEEKKVLTLTASFAPSFTLFKVAAFPGRPSLWNELFLGVNSKVTVEHN